MEKRTTLSFNLLSSNFQSLLVSSDGVAACQGEEGKVYSVEKQAN